jgi:hypothetical protein
LEKSPTAKQTGVLSGVEQQLPDLFWSFRGLHKNGNEDAKNSRHGEAKTRRSI